MSIRTPCRSRPCEKMVGVRGFEPPTPSSRTRCATRLRYTPMSRRRNGASRALIVKALAGGKTAFSLFGPLVAAPFRAAAQRCASPRHAIARRGLTQTKSGRKAAWRMAGGVAGRRAALYGPRPPVLRRVGASPSGKAADFDSAIRRFESSRPSHAFASSADFVGSRAEARILWAFAESGNRRPDISGRVTPNSAPGLQWRFPNFQNRFAADFADPVRFDRDRFDWRGRTEKGRRSALGDERNFQARR